MSTAPEGRTLYAEASLTQLPSLLKRFCDQFLTLFDIQLALFKTELKGGVKIYAKHLILTVFSALVALIGFSFLSVGLAFWANAHIRNLALSFACVGGAYLIIGVISTLAAVRRITNLAPLLDETREELERDQQWIRTGIQAR